MLTLFSAHVINFALLPAVASKLIFEALDVTGSMPDLEQSSVDCVVDAGLLDKLITTKVPRVDIAGTIW